MCHNYPYWLYPDLQRSFDNMQIEGFRQVSNTSRNENRHHNSNCKFNRENFNIENEQICGSDSCKKLILNELNAKYLDRIKSSSEKIRLLKDRVASIHNEIGQLNNKINDINNSSMRNYTSFYKDLYDAKIMNIEKSISNLRNELVRVENEITYLTSYDIEFKQLRDEIMPIPTT